MAKTGRAREHKNERQQENERENKRARERTRERESEREGPLHEGVLHTQQTKHLLNIRRLFHLRNTRQTDVHQTIIINIICWG